MNVLCIIAFIGYQYAFFSYNDYVCNTEGSSRKGRIGVTLVNGIVFSAHIVLNGFGYEGVMMLLYFLLLILELYALYGECNLKFLAGTLSFVVNLFAIRLVVMGGVALYRGTTIARCLVNVEERIGIGTLSFLIMCIYVVLAKGGIAKECMDMILTEKKNLKFICSVLGAVYVYMMIHACLLYTTTETTRFIWAHINVALCGLLSFILTIVYAYIFARLQLYVSKYNKLSHCIQEEEAAAKALEVEATRDAFTGCRTRELAVQRLQHYLEKHMAFYIILIDIDGLKKVNDAYGHTEGDFYIQKVVKVMEYTFEEEIIARFGGDEFLVIGLGSDPYLPTKKAMQCYEQSRRIKEVYNKPYGTSVSYGIVNVSSDTKLTVMEMLHLVDSRMYELKKSRKKDRIVVRPW
ncbi:MAG: GGDEF domain-containing protein [Cellulosilyticaceae bacterium]